MAAQKGVQSRPPEARALDRTQRSIQHTHNPTEEEHAIRTDSAEEVLSVSRLSLSTFSFSLYVPGVGRCQIQPGRPRIREVLGRSVAPVATKPDDKRAGGRVEGRNSGAFIGRDPKTPPKVGEFFLI